MPRRSSGVAVDSQSKTTIRLGKRARDSPLEGKTSKRSKTEHLEATEQPPGTATPTGRPRRNATKPKRFDDAESPDAIIGDSTAPNKEMGPKLTIKSKRKSAVATPSEDEDEQPASYSADFLTNYIDDTPPVTPGPNSRTETPPARRVSAPLPGNPYKQTKTAAARRESAPVRSSEPSQQKVAPPDGPGAGAAAEQAYYAEISEKPPVPDDEPTMLLKLDAAIVALRNLNIPVPACPELSKDIESHQGDSQTRSATRGRAPETMPLSRTGTPDTELRILISNAIGLVERVCNDKLRLLSMMSEAAASPGDPSLHAAITADRAASAALTILHQSSALNINCIMSPQKGKRMWILYMALLYLINPPAPSPDTMMPPPPRPVSDQQIHYPSQASEVAPNNLKAAHHSNSVTYQCSTVEVAAADLNTHQLHGKNGPPPPHQFLLRGKNSNGTTPSPSPTQNKMPPPPNIPCPKTSKTSQVGAKWQHKATRPIAGYGPKKSSKKAAETPPDSPVSAQRLHGDKTKEKADSWRSFGLKS